MKLFQNKKIFFLQKTFGRKCKRQSLSPQGLEAILKNNSKFKKNINKNIDKINSIIIIHIHLKSP